MKKKILKTLILVLILIALIFVCYKTYLYKFARKIEDACIEAIGNNYYQKTVNVDENNNNGIGREMWYTDKNQKAIIILPNNVAKQTIYRNAEKQTITTLYEITDESGTHTDDVVSILLEKDSEFGPLYMNTVKNRFITNQGYVLENDEYSFKDIIQSYLTTIIYLDYVKTENVDNKECYVFSFGKFYQKIYIDKETNLIHKIEQGGGSVNFEFVTNIVTEEDIALPDLSNYYVNVF